MNKNILFISLSVVLIAALAGIFFVIREIRQGTKRLDLESEKKLLSQKEEMENIKKQPAEIEILFVGDLMFDRHIREKAEKNGNDFVFEKIKNLLAESDLVVANLEGPITENKSVSVASKMGDINNFTFTFDKSLAKTLFNHNVKLVNLGNNHILNFGADGVNQTKKHLSESNVEYFGDVPGAGTIHELSLDGIRIGFVSYNQFGGEGTEKALENIMNLKSKVDFIIVYTHWGEEYKPEPSENIKSLAHSFVDAGADLVIGSHPHVVQSKEKYNNKMIYYSLGNFVFDQYFSEETKNGLAVKVKIRPDKTMEFEDIRLLMDSSGQTKAAD